MSARRNATVSLELAGGLFVDQVFVGIKSQ
jgi:hypothetical protein